MTRLNTLTAFWITALTIGHGNFGIAGTASEVGSLAIKGQTLDYWIAQASSENGPEDLRQTVAALASAVENDNPKAKVGAADALALLGPEAKAALPALLAQFDHEFNWVRVSCQAAVGSMGREAIPGLIETMEQHAGGPRVRAAFVLGGMGDIAKPAVPALLRVMKDESPAVQERFAGILRQIDPERFDVEGATKIGTLAKLMGTKGGASVTSQTDDWPQFHGPARDSICREEGLLQEWPEDGPELLWTVDGLGRGYSTVSIAEGVAYTMGDLPNGDEEAQHVIAIDLLSRQQRWATRIGPPHRDGGPRSTPAVDGSRVYAIGTDGELACLDTETGDILWSKDLAGDFDGKFMAVWKFSESPLVDGDRVICTPGGPEATMVALNKHNGDVIWKCVVPHLGNKGADGAGYSSAVVAEICGVRQYVQMIGRGVIGVEAATGRFLWGYNRIACNIANICSPTVRGDYVFATTSYNTGSVLLEISCKGEQFQAKEVYFLRSKDFQNHHGGIVLVGDYVYGGHGQNRGDPACVELATGEVVWKERSPVRGSAAVLYADGHLVFRYDRGEVLLIEATPEGLNIKGRFQAPEDEGPAWAHPVIHQGKLYLRHADVLLCYDVRPS